MKNNQNLKIVFPDDNNTLELPLEGKTEVVIGRSRDSGSTLEIPDISRVQLVLWQDKNKRTPYYFVTQLSSKVDTFINGKSLMQNPDYNQPLRNDDVITFASTNVKVIFEDEDDTQFEPGVNGSASTNTSLEKQIPGEAARKKGFEHNEEDGFFTYKGKEIHLSPKLNTLMTKLYESYPNTYHNKEIIEEFDPIVRRLDPNEFVRDVRTKIRKELINSGSDGDFFDKLILNIPRYGYKLNLE